MRLKKGPPDFILFMTTVILVCVGLIMVFSSSSVTANLKFDDPYYFFKRQLLWALIALVVMMVVMKINYHRLKDLAVPALVVAVICLVIVIFTPEVKGSSRYLGVGPLRFTPSELAKLCMVLFLAATLSRRLDRNYFLARPGSIFGHYRAGSGIVMLQPDLGTAFVMGVTSLLMLVMAGAKMAHMGVLAGLGVALVGLAVILSLSVSSV